MATATANTNSNVVAGATELQEKPVRVLLLGSGKVGKTGIVRRFLQEGFDDKYQPTVEDLHQRTFHVRGQVANIEIMDTSGSYDFPAMRQVWIKAASAFVLVFAQNDLYSFRHVQNLVQNIREERANYQDLPLVVVCNKVDLPITEKSFSDGTIEMWVSEVDLTTNQFVYASAKTNQGVTDVFLKLWQQNAEHPLPQFQGASSTSLLSRRRFSASNNAETLPTDNSAQSQQEQSKSKVTTLAPHSPSHTATTRSPLQNPQKGSKGLLLHRFGSQKRQNPAKDKNKRGNRNEQVPIKLDCVIS